MYYHPRKAVKKNEEGKCYVNRCRSDVVTTVVVKGIPWGVCTTHKTRHLPLK